jgi:hypothetical protein
MMGVCEHDCRPAAWQGGGAATRIMHAQGDNERASACIKICSEGFKFCSGLGGFVDTEMASLRQKSAPQKCIERKRNISVTAAQFGHSCARSLFTDSTVNLGM